MKYGINYMGNNNYICLNRDRTMDLEQVLDISAVEEYERLKDRLHLTEEEENRLPHEKQVYVSGRWCYFE